MEFRCTNDLMRSLNSKRNILTDDCQPYEEFDYFGFSINYRFVGT